MINASLILRTHHITLTAQTLLNSLPLIIERLVSSQDHPDHTARDRANDSTFRGVTGYRAI